MIIKKRQSKIPPVILSIKEILLIIFLMLVNLAFVSADSTNCTDSDDGKNIYVSGVTITEDTIHGGTLHMTADSCARKLNESEKKSTEAQYLEDISSCSGDNCYVAEGYCGESKTWNGSVDKKDYISCQNRCIEGKCITEGFWQKIVSWFRGLFS